jgi:formylglycine-generating enzyme required for sulfatase activity
MAHARILTAAAVALFLAPLAAQDPGPGAPKPAGEAPGAGDPQARARDAVARELPKLRDPAVQAGLAAALARALEARRGDLSGASRDAAARAFEGDVEKALADTAGPTLARALAAPLAASLLEAGRAGPLEGPEALAGAVTRLLGSEDAAAIFERLVRPTLLASRDTRPEKVRLGEELAAIEARIAREEQSLSEARAAAAAGLQKLRQAQVLEGLGRSLAEAFTARRDEIRGEQIAAVADELEREASRMIAEASAPVLASVLAGHVSSAFLDAARKPSIDGPALLKGVLEDVVGNEPPDAVFDALLRPGLSQALTEAEARRQVVRDRLEAIARQEARLRSGIPMGMVEIPAGTYRIGIDDADIRALAQALGYRTQMEAVLHAYHSSPSRTETLPAFYIDENEVICRWYLAYLAEHPRAMVPRYWPNGRCPDDWLDRPLTGISFEQAVAFARWMGRRLPTEVEWEAAARSPTGTGRSQEKYFWTWGDKWDPRQIRCNFDGALSHPARALVRDGFPKLTPPGTFPDSRTLQGVNDLLGNANEFTTTPFLPYKGFKRVEINKRSLSEADFDEEMVTVRGGDFGKKDILVTTFARWGIRPQVTANYVGFRTAASKDRGADLFAYLAADGDILSWQADYHPLPSDQLVGRRGALFHLEDPTWFYCLQSGGFDVEAELPCSARYVAAASRVAEDFRDLNTLRQLARGAPEEAIAIGYIKLDYPSLDPPLPAGHYFVRWQNSVKKVEETEDTADGGGPKPRTGPPKKPVMLPEALLVEQRGVKDPAVVRIESFPPPIVSAQIPTRIAKSPGSDLLEFTFAFPIKYQAKKTFSVTLRLRFASEVVQALE